MSPINVTQMDSSDKDNSSQKYLCTLCSIFGQFVVSEDPKKDPKNPEDPEDPNDPEDPEDPKKDPKKDPEDPIERLAKTADAVLLPWRTGEKPLECKDLSHETWLELLRKMNELIETEWHTGRGDFIFNEKGNKDDNMNKATVAENVVSNALGYAVLDYPVFCSYFWWNHYEVDTLALVLYRYMGAVYFAGTPQIAQLNELFF